MTATVDQRRRALAAPEPRPERPGPSAILTAYRDAHSALSASATLALARAARCPPVSHRLRVIFEAQDNG